MTRPVWGFIFVTRDVVEISSRHLIGANSHHQKTSVKSQKLD